MRPSLTLRHYLEAPIAHSHDHAQLVFGLSGHLDLEVDGCGSQVRESSVMVLPFSAHHACGSRDGSRCLVLDVPTEHWLLQSLGEHADASRRLLDQPARLALDSRQHQLVQWLAHSPVDDPLIVQQGAVLLLASLNHPQAPQGAGPPPAVCGIQCAYRATRCPSVAGRRPGAYRRPVGGTPACALYRRMRADAHGLHPQPAPATGPEPAARDAVAHR